MKNILYVLIACGIAWQACGDKEDIDSPASSNMQNLTNGEWTRVKHELNGTDVMPIFPECSKDDYTQYRNDGTAFIDQGDNMCDSTFPARTTWKWKFIENETKMEETLDDSTIYVREIRTLTNSYFEYVSYYTQSDSLVSGFEKL